MVWFRRQMYEGVWWAYVSIVPQTMKPSIVLSVLPGGGRTHSITGLQAVVLATRARARTNTRANAHTFSEELEAKAKTRTVGGVRLKIQPWFAQHWWVKATVVMSRVGRGLTISKSAAKKKMMWWDCARISWKHTADSGVLFDRSSIVIKSKDKKMFLGGTQVTKGQWLRK